MRAPEKRGVREFQVGMLLLAGVLAASVFSFRLTDYPIFRRGTVFVVYLNDATGIFRKSKVKMAGIDIGFIRNINLDEGKARLTLVIDRGVEIPVGSEAVPRPLGILGDKYIEIVLPGEDENGEALESLGASGSVFDRVRTLILPEAHANRVHKDGKVLRARESGATLDDLQRQMGDIGQDLKAISSDMRGLVERNEQALGSSIQSFNRILLKVEKTLEGLDEDKIAKDLEKLGTSVESINKSLERVDSITRKIDDGEGTLGALLNETDTIDSINQSLREINSFLNRANRTEISLALSSEYDFRASSTRTYFGLSLRPREDYAYLFNVLFDEGGVLTRKTLVTRTDGAPPIVVETEETDESAFKFSFQLAKRVSDLRFRIGLFENSGGVAADYLLFHDSLRLSLELFDAGRGGIAPPNLKAFAEYRFWDHFSVRVGGNELLARSSRHQTRPAFFAGVGLSFVDSDLKALAVLPASF